jgi:hypothetical protein
MELILLVSENRILLYKGHRQGMHRFHIESPGSLATKGQEVDEWTPEPLG